MKVLILYASGSEQSILSKAVAYLKASQDISDESVKTGNSITVADIATMTNVAGITTYLSSTLSASHGTFDDVYICAPTSTNGTNLTTMTYDQVAYCDILLKTAKKGTVVLTGTALDSNSTATEFIIPAADEPSSEDDAYNGMFLKTTGTTAVYRMITDYTGSTRLGLIVTSTTPLTTTEAYTIYENAHVHVIGDASSAKKACRVAWETLYPNVVAPPLIAVMSGSGTASGGLYDGDAFAAHEKVGKTATDIAATTLSDTGEFTLGKYDGDNYYVAIEGATLGDGQVRKITSNTADALTLEGAAWPSITPTGTVTYQITAGNYMTLYEFYLPYSIKTYLASHTTANSEIFREMLDRYNNRKDSGATQFKSNTVLIDEYAMMGKAIFDALNAGVVAAP